MAAARRSFAELTKSDQEKRAADIEERVRQWLADGPLRRRCDCPVCKSQALMTGESLSRGPVQVDESSATIQREVRVLPNSFRCPFCFLKLSGYQEMLEAGLGDIYVVVEDEDPIEFFGIIPEDHVDVDKIVRDYYEEGYNNE